MVALIVRSIFDVADISCSSGIIDVDWRCKVMGHTTLCAYSPGSACQTSHSTKQCLSDIYNGNFPEVVAGSGA